MENYLLVNLNIICENVVHIVIAKQSVIHQWADKKMCHLSQVNSNVPSMRTNILIATAPIILFGIG